MSVLREVLPEMILLNNHKFGVLVVPYFDYISTAKTFETRSDQDLFSLHVFDIRKLQILN